jgi:uncharacterized protein
MINPVSLQAFKPARNFRERLVGLLGRSTLPKGQGIWLTPCKAVHTIGMQFSIDVVFVARDGTVLRIDQAVPPGRICLCWRACSIIEMSAGWASEMGLRCGVRIVRPAQIQGGCE